MVLVESWTESFGEDIKARKSHFEELLNLASERQYHDGTCQAACYTDKCDARFLISHSRNNLSTSYQVSPFPLYQKCKPNRREPGSQSPPTCVDQSKPTQTDSHAMIIVVFCMLQNATPQYHTSIKQSQKFFFPDFMTRRQYPALQPW
jgi:hypothetical protein